MVGETGPFLHEEAWRRSFEGHVIVDCAVRDRNILYLVLRRSIPEDQVSLTWDHDVPTRFVALFLHVEELRGRWAHQGLDGFRRPRCGASREPIGQGLAVSSSGDVFASGSRQTAMEQITPDDPPGAIKNVRMIGGRAYAVGLLREVYRRVAVGRWEKLDQGLPPLGEEDLGVEGMHDLGFRDIDGFAEDDLYAAGGLGDLWHYDGNAWSVCELPTNLPLHAVCCAGDGQVYLVGEGNTLLRGRGDTWREIRRAEETVPYNDARWFDGKLWLCSDYRLDVLEGGEVKRPEHNGGPVLLWGHMDAQDGVLMVAGQEGVHLYDGRDWRVIVQPY